ncbi:MAG: DUF262 domain-containing protein [Acidobacteriota bacterium]|nr:DUF262 domain-containing protein [Acidobacteriota bacterium]
MPSKLENLNSVFNYKILRMPDYQRGYSWEEKKHLNDLWNDLENVNVDSYHFTGIITLEKIEDASKRRWETEFEISENLTTFITNQEYTPYFVVDGQQRLVSLIILLALLRNELEEKNEEISEKFISIKKEDKNSYLFGYEKDTPSHQYLIGKIFEDETMEVTEPETIYTRNLSRAKKFFKNKLKDADSFEKRRLYTKLTEKLLFNVFEIESKKLDISLVFETLNYRGKQLSKLELFKNRLIFLITKRHPDKADKLRKDVISTWQDIYEWLGKNKNNELNDDDFLRAFWIMFFRHDGEGYHRTDSDFKKFEEDIFEKKYKISDIKKNPLLTDYELDKLLKNLSEAIKYWFFIHNPDYDFNRFYNQEKFNFSDGIRRTLRKLLRNRYGEFMKPLILAYFLRIFRENEYYKIEELLLEIERHNYCVYLLAGKQADTNRADFSRTVNQFFRENKKHDEVIEKIRIETNKELNWANIFNHIHRNRANNQRFYDWNGSKYTFWEWEQYLKSESESILKDYSKAETYLIFPDPDKSSFYRDKSFGDVVKGRDRQSILKICYSLGNISINNKARNPNSYSKTRENLFNGSYSDIDIAEKYNVWTDKNILQRGLRVLNFIENQWNVEYNVSEGDAAQKRNQLLLDGVKVIS